MAMELSDMDKVKAIAKMTGLRPGRVLGFDIVQFTKGNNPRISPCSWEEFEETLERRGLAVYTCGTWIKIMKKPQDKE